ncbi:hypothetical protein K3495_g6516 [Podosphaera aphanis]|nr:hypothetical protein K3495_g6516 [Podosphaera aphanis]
MILTVPKIRVEEGWVGIISVVWALTMSLWTVFTDRIVTRGKKEEEERLTGRPENRRTLLEWLAVFSSTIVLITIMGLAFLLSCALIIRARDSSLRVPGELYNVDGGKYQIHLFCSAKNTQLSNYTQAPTILFEAGQGAFDGSMVHVAENALANGSITRYCYSDRPGIAWSDNAPSPFSAGMAEDVLSEALAHADERGPWILVSSGVGSIYSRIFSSRHGSNIKGLLLIDPLHEDYLNRLGAPTQSFLLWIRGVLSPLGLDQISAAVFKGRTREDRIFGRSAKQNGKYIKAKLQESLVAGSFTKNEIISAKTIQDENVPFALISSGIEVKKSSEWEAKQRELSQLTKNLLSWDIVDEAPAEVWITSRGREIIEKRLKELIKANSN